MMIGGAFLVSEPIVAKDLIPLSLGPKYDGGNTVTVHCRPEELFVLQNCISWPPGHTNTDS